MLFIRSFAPNNSTELLVRLGIVAVVKRPHLWLNYNWAVLRQTEHNKSSIYRFMCVLRERCGFSLAVCVCASPDLSGPLWQIISINVGYCSVRVAGSSFQREIRPIFDFGKGCNVNQLLPIFFVFSLRQRHQLVVDLLFLKKDLNGITTSSIL